MARAKNGGNGRLEEAMALVIQNQASFLAQLAEINRRIAETDRISSERFARIEGLLLEHSRILADHSRILTYHSRILTDQGKILADHTRILQALPETIRQKIGFKTPQPPA
jgi:hypothetical protein